MGESNAMAQAIERDGFALLPGIYDDSAITRLSESLTAALDRESGEAVRRCSQGHVFAARNLLAIWPESRTCWRLPQVIDGLAEVLGPSFGLVRGLYFDKPPERTWSLPWHKDVTIAVRDNSIPSTQFSNPTTKIAVPHVEASTELLERMLTIRIHLDAVSDENGALVVIPGSHRNGKEMSRDDSGATTIAAERGDVLLIRPLVAHCSASSQPGTTLHRRIVHLEFAADRRLPDGYEWYEFVSNANDYSA